MSYVPPHLRNREGGAADASPAPLEQRLARGGGGGGREERFGGRRDERQAGGGGGGGPVSPSPRANMRSMPVGGGGGSGPVAPSPRANMRSMPVGGPPPRDDPPRGGGGRDERHGGGRSGRPKGAPSRFGSIGRKMDGALRAGEDVPGGRRIDEEGMVYEMGDRSIKYFMDRGRKYPFTAGPEALPLLRGLITVNERINGIVNAIVAATDDPAATLAQGETLYADKPTMKAHHGAKGTWSDSEYAHPGLQAVYLRLKSFQRFTESWALYERAAAHGIFDKYLAAAGSAGGAAGPPPLRVVSLGGGPGYELLAFEWFLSYWASVGGKTPAERASWLASRTFAAGQRGAAKADGGGDGDACAAALGSASLGGGTDTDGAGRCVPPLRLMSLDLQPSWEPYVAALAGTGRPDVTYGFAQWDIHEGDALSTSGLSAIEVCVVSNVLVYCTDEPTADVFAELLTKHKVHAILFPVPSLYLPCTFPVPSHHKVHAILFNERGAEQKMVEMVQRRGIVVVRLMSQEAGRDDRQLIFLPPGSAVGQAASLTAPARADAAPSPPAAATAAPSSAEPAAEVAASPAPVDISDEVPLVFGMKKVGSSASWADEMDEAPPPELQEVRPSQGARSSASTGAPASDTVFPNGAGPATPFNPRPSAHCLSPPHPAHGPRRSPEPAQCRTRRTRAGERTR